MREQTVCFSGHREIPPEGKNRIKKELDKTVLGLIERGYTVFYTGGASGFDRMATECVLEYKKSCPDIKVRIIFPFKGCRGEKEYKDIIPLCDGIEYACERYLPWCYHERNRMMVDRSSVCVCYLTKQSGGTAYTANYAKDKGLDIILI